MHARLQMRSNFNTSKLLNLQKKAAMRISTAVTTINSSATDYFELLAAMKEKDYKES